MTERKRRIRLRRVVLERKKKKNVRVEIVTKIKSSGKTKKIQKNWKRYNSKQTSKKKILVMLERRKHVRGGAFGALEVLGKPWKGRDVR